MGSRYRCISAPSKPSEITTSVSPQAKACCASTISQRDIMRNARLLPTSWHKSGPPPHALLIANRAWMKPIRACAACRRLSHTSASSAPPPIASPFKYARTGARHCRIASSALREPSAIACVAPSSRTDESSRRSPPAAKNRSPLPQSKMRRVLDLAPSWLIALESDCSTRPASALCF